MAERILTKNKEFDKTQIVYGRLTRVGPWFKYDRQFNKGCVLRCQCGTLTVARRSCLTRGTTVSCGCYHRERVTEKSTSHGLHDAMKAECGIYWLMMRRCFKKDSPAYASYGGRGITVCDRWKGSVANFIEDMGRRPSADYSLDRIDNNGNYEPGNCRWATNLEQSNNRRSNRFVTIGEATMTVAQWSRQPGVKRNRHLIGHRLNKGLSPEEAIFG